MSTTTSAAAIAAGAGAWQPAIVLDAKTVSAQAFTEALEKFWAEAKKRANADKLPVNPFDHDGWYDITPEMAEAGLMYSGGNRDISLPAIRLGVHDLLAADWKETGETVCFSGGKLFNGHHRLLMALLSGQPIRTYVVVSVPAADNLFSYYDSGKKRNAYDALHISGWNGAGKVIAKAVEQLAVRYDADALGVQKQPRFTPVRPREVLGYLATNPSLQDAAHLMLTNYDDAVDVIRSKPAAVFFAWKVVQAYGEARLDTFCSALGSGANLDEDSPILAAIRKLMAPEMPGKKMADRTRLAYVSKAFNMWVNGQKMPRSRGRISPLAVDIDEPFPRIAADPLANAAE
jgi:hypothetical protein